MSIVIDFSSGTSSAEIPMKYAPSIELPNGYTIIPQHYLRYQQTLNSVCALLNDIQFDDKTLLFAGQDHNGLYLQVGMIGRENYARHDEQRPHKLVYGRKWRIDADTPTSEVIQTAFLAISKAYEHEVRELFTVLDAWQDQMSTPFSCHQDLPLLAANAELIVVEAQPCLAVAEIKQLLETVKFAQRKIELVNFYEQRSFRYLLLRLGDAPLARQQEGDLAHFNQALLSVTLQQGTASEILFALLDSLLHFNQRWVEENFYYQGFARFSRRLDPQGIAAISVASRPYRRDAKNENFSHAFQHANYEVDRSRVPHWGTGALAKRNREILQTYQGLQGHLPINIQEMKKRVSNR